jgi:hypothetical protein
VWCRGGIIPWPCSRVHPGTGGRREAAHPNGLIGKVLDGDA